MHIMPGHVHARARGRPGLWNPDKQIQAHLLQPHAFTANSPHPLGRGGSSEPGGGGGGCPGGDGGGSEGGGGGAYLGAA